jgi:hypothetical protein
MLRAYVTSFLLQLKKLSENVYGDIYVKNEEGETSQSKEDGDVSQIIHKMMPLSFSIVSNILLIPTFSECDTNGMHQLCGK